MPRQCDVTLTAEHGVNMWRAALHFPGTGELERLLEFGKNVVLGVVLWHVGDAHFINRANHGDDRAVRYCFLHQALLDGFHYFFAGLYLDRQQPPYSSPRSASFIAFLVSREDSSVRAARSPRHTCPGARFRTRWRTTALHHRAAASRGLQTSVVSLIATVTSRSEGVRTGRLGAVSSSSASCAAGFQSEPRVRASTAVRYSRRASVSWPMARITSSA